MSTRSYCPDRGDVVWLQFSPQSGHEQAGSRPALVISPKSYNSKVGLALFCPITSQVKGYPFEVAIVDENIQGVVLSDQLKSLDWKSRNIKLISKVSQSIINQVVGKFSTLLIP